MKKTETAYFVVDADRTANLDETIGLFTDGSDLNYDYSMSVPDLISVRRPARPRHVLRAARSRSWTSCRRSCAASR